MCGRFTITVTIGLPERFGVKSAGIRIEPRFNIAPSQPVPVIILPESGERSIMEMVWGLVPHWAEDPSAVRRPINARGESLAERPSFRSPLQRSRCLVPANGFYEWKKAGKVSEPYYIHRKDDGLCAIAGLYDTWRGPDGSLLRTFVIITTEANSLVSRYHDRMPALLREDDEARWLEPGRLPDRLVAEILTPYPADLLEAYRVSRQVNDATREGEDLIRKVPDSTLPV
ncbi:MAG: SOS response-associated peptidase [Methanomicrobiales archaeon]|nr:SOS response-associated peptidase [Methanomicrobiales archaeon]NYT20204.1 SOS response-associated peptidase [Methanomicrobiales archaeon]